MLNWIIKTGLKFVSFETLVKTIATGIAYVLEYARKSASEEGWEKAKATIKVIRGWLDLFDEVYSDDTLTPDEEKKIQNAISECTLTSTIYDLIQGKTPPSKAKVVKKQEKKSHAKKETSKKKGEAK